MTVTKLGGDAGFDFKQVKSVNAAYSITPGDHGTIFMVIQTSSAYTLLLPSVDDIQAGWKTKFILKTASSGTVTIGCTSGDGDKLFGMIVSADGASAESQDSAGDDITFEGSKAAPGDWCQVEFDGDYFYVHGQEHDADHMTLG